jgi:hypothetical protein
MFRIISFLLPLLLLFSSIFCFAENRFSIANGSKNYTAEIIVEKCEDKACEGKGTVKLYDKKTNELFQIFPSDDLRFDINENSGPSVNIVQLYGEQSPLIFDDFNFDGIEDLAIRNGSKGSYGAPSFDVYLYDIKKRQFVLNKELTALATDNLGMFSTDKKRKRLITFFKSGCCWHLTTEYTFEPRRGLLKVYELEEDATIIDGETVKVTTRELIGKKWKIKVNKYKKKDYYK